MMPDDSTFGPPWLAKVNAVFMILCLAFGFAAVVFTGLKIDWPEVDDGALVGEWTGPYERSMDDDFITRETAITLWGTVQWTLFREGRYGVVPGHDDWLFTVEEFEQPDDADAIVAQKLEQIVAVRRLLAEAGVDRLVIALVPDKSRIYSDMLDDIARRPDHADRYQAFRGALLDAGLVAPDLLSPLHEARATVQTHMHTDTHWTPAGAEVAARAVAAAVEAMDDRPPGLHGSHFVTEEGETIGHDGDLLRFLPLGDLRTALWGPPEPLTERSTRELSAGDLADASGGDDLGGLLFGDVTIPAVLVGTSFSAMDEWNFDGALKEALGMDVLNMADKGEGPMVPMADYLASDALRDSPPEIVIWEIPERFLPVAYDLPEDAF